MINLRSNVLVGGDHEKTYWLEDCGTYQYGVHEETHTCWRRQIGKPQTEPGQPYVDPKYSRDEDAVMCVWPDGWHHEISDLSVGEYKSWPSEATCASSNIIWTKVVNCQTWQVALRKDIKLIMALYIKTDSKATQQHKCGMVIEKCPGGQARAVEILKQIVHEHEHSNLAIEHFYKRRDEIEPALSNRTSTERVACSKMAAAACSKKPAGSKMAAAACSKTPAGITKLDITAEPDQPMLDITAKPDQPTFDITAEPVEPDMASPPLIQWTLMSNGTSFFEKLIVSGPL